MEIGLHGGRHCTHPGVLLGFIISYLDPDTEISVSVWKFTEE